MNLDFFDILMGYDGKSKGLPNCRKPFAVLCFMVRLAHFFDAASTAFAAGGCGAAFVVNIAAAAGIGFDLFIGGNMDVASAAGTDAANIGN